MGHLPHVFLPAFCENGTETETKEAFMGNRSTQHLGREHWLALMLLIATLILWLVQLAGLVASYLPPDPYGLQPHLYYLFFPLLGCLLFCIYLLRTSREILRQPLPLATLAGLVLGTFLGSISNLPYYLGLLLAFGAFGPLMALTSADPMEAAQTYKVLDFWLSMLAVILALSLYALVASFVTRRTGHLRYGLWGALLTAFVTLLVGTLTSSLMYLLQSFPSPPQETLPIVISFQYLPTTLFPLSIVQALHAVIGGYIGAVIALRHLHKRRANTESL